MISTGATEGNFDPKSNPFKPAWRYSNCLNNGKFAISCEYWVVQLRGLVLGKVRLRDTLIPGKGQGRGLPTKNNLQMHNVVLSLNYTVEQILRDTLILGKGQGWEPPWKHYLQILNAICTRCCCIALWRLLLHCEDERWLFVDHSDGDIFPLRVIRILDIRCCDNTPGYFKTDIFPYRYVGWLSYYIASFK